MQAHNYSPLSLLIADDDEDDQLMLKSAFEDVGFSGPIHTVGNGEEVLAVLNELVEKGPSEVPRLVMLDLNMPKKDGRFALREIRKHSVLNKLPVIMYTTSTNPEDIRMCYELGASSFIGKPSSYNDLKNIAELVVKYWFNVVLTATPVQK